MSFTPPAPSSSQPASKGGGLGKRKIEIVTIPEKFYGVALTMNGQTQAERDAPPPPPPPPKPTPPPAAMVKPPERPSPWPFVVLIVVLVLGVGSVFAYVNRDVLFPKPAPAPAPPAPKVPPSAPANLSATASGSAISLVWTDGGGDMTGVRIERKEGNNAYAPVTVLPVGSVAFLDVSVEASKSYQYRVVAFGEGGESSPSNEASARLPDPTPPPPPPPAAPALPPGGLDSDSDGLTDVEEPLYGTDARNPDADSDGFLDGNEVFHLYNPAAKSPVRLLDSGLVKLFSAPVGWSLLVPMNWTAGLDIPDGSQASMTSGRGEVVTLRIEDNPTGASLADWYSARTPGESASSVRAFLTKSGLQGISAGDRLETAFAWGNKVFTVKYGTGGQPFINYRTTFEMMLNSLKLVGVPTVSVSTDASSGPGSLTGTTTSTPSAPPVPSGIVSSSTMPVLFPVDATSTTSATATTSTTSVSSTRP